MSIREYLLTACRDDARRAGERNRLLLEARRARRASRHRPEPTAPASAAPVRWLARLISAALPPLSHPGPTTFNSRSNAGVSRIK